MNSEILDDPREKHEIQKASNSHFRVFHGLLQMGLSAFVVYFYIKLWIHYQYSGIILMFIYPNWMLALFISMGLVGMYSGFLVTIGRLKPREGYLRLMLFLGIGIATEFLFNL